jgi:hypothetical protein
MKMWILGGAALQCVRENSFSSNPVERNVRESSPLGAPELSPALHNLRKKPALPLLLGGAAVYRCGNCLVLNSALAAEGAALDQELLFPQVVQRWEKRKKLIKSRRDDRVLTHTLQRCDRGIDLTKASAPEVAP